MNKVPTDYKILKDMVELRGLVGGLQAKRGGAPFPTKSAKELCIKLRASADSLGMVIAGGIISQSVTQLPCERGTLCHAVTTVRFMSDDGSYLDFVGSGHGGDVPSDKGTGGGDKAGGKASTYSWKDAVTKALCAPDQEMVDTDDEMPEVVQSKPNYSFGKPR